MFTGGCCELCKPAICALFISSLPGGQASSRVCQFAVIISICSHLKRLANPRSHASSVPRIICVCFLTRRRDCVNLLTGKEREREREMEEKKRRRETSVLLVSFLNKNQNKKWKRKTRDLWEWNKTRDKWQRDGEAAEEEQSQKGDLGESLFSLLCSSACWQKCPKLSLSSDKCDVWSWFRMHKIKKELNLPRTAGRWAHTTDHICTHCAVYTHSHVCSP